MDGPTGSVILGLVVGIGFVVLFSAFSPSAGPISGTVNSATVNLNLSANDGDSIEPEMHSFDGNVYVIWSDRNQENTEVFFRRSVDGGSYFHETQNLSQDQSDSYHPKIAAFGEDVYVIWENRDPGKSEILLRASSDKGASFADIINISSSRGSSTLPQIAASANGIYMVWVDESPSNGDHYDVLFLMAAHGAENFGSTLQLSNTEDDEKGNGEMHSWTPQIALSSNSHNVFVVWQQQVHNGASDILLSRSVDGGSTFSPPIALSAAGLFSYNPKIICSGDYVYVVWSSYLRDPEATEVIFARSDDGGETFSVPLNLSNTRSESNSPQLVASNSNVYVVWSEYRETAGDEIFMRSSSDFGSTFSSATNLSNYVGASSQPKIAAFGSRAHVAWTENGDIYYMIMGDGGKSAGAKLNLSNSHAISFNPKILADSSKLYISWQESHNGNSEIFFNKR